MVDDSSSWWAGALGPGWKQVSEDPIKYTNDTLWPDGHTTNETFVVRSDGTSLWIKSSSTETRDFTHPANWDKDSTTTYTEHDVDGAVTSVRSEVTSEEFTPNGGKTWFTILTENGQDTIQRGVSYDGTHGGSNVVTTNRTDGTTRTETVTWTVAREGTRITSDTDVDGNTTSYTDDVVLNDDGNWVHNPSDTDDDDPGDEPAVVSNDDGSDGGDGPDGGSDGGGEFGPGGPDTGDGSQGDDGGDDGDGDDDDDDGPGPPRPPGPVPPPDVVE